ncbi:hypothetical protein KIH27_13895 [Mycobacterium sp. M1]|uniref:Aminoglycoside phosphotransferase domain-containing protein n=1 Tax=Mycolicibacter acidiphilus TaxID=2835306 RepID=A0ABS5RMH4_9MYCO|nr:hypothetical protein [Mycolicibacter acidiphilus]MBS9534681.1 hypothetical protein [Mycolicibacter acidiphilus]
MFGVIVDEHERGTAADDPDDLTAITRAQLQRYGISTLVELAPDDEIDDVIDGATAPDDVVVICAAEQLTPPVIRLLTLRSVRVPAHFIVRNPDDDGRIIAARVARADLAELNHRNHRDFEDDLRKLAEIRKLHRYDFENVTANDAIRVGGSFAKSGVRPYFHKQATGRGSVKLRDEARFYTSLPRALRDSYPQVLFSQVDGESTRLGLDYVGHPNLRDLLLNLQITPRHAASVLEQVLDYEYRHAYRAHSTPTPANYLQDYHFTRVWNRLAVTIDLDPDFAPLIRSQRLQVNGRVMPNVPAMLLQLERDAHAVTRLTPEGVSPHIHGDLHLENILYDQESDKFWLVDPRGYPVCDIYYDLGKLSHSYNGHYDLLHEGRHEVSHMVSGDTAILDFALRSPHLESVYNQLGRIMRGSIADILDTDFEQVESRIRFNEAMHFCSDMPFHIHAEAAPNVAAAIYATGALLLAQVLDDFSIEPDFSTNLHHDALTRITDRAAVEWRFLS